MAPDRPIKTWDDLTKFANALHRAFCDIVITRDEMDRAYDKARAELMRHMRKPGRQALNQKDKSDAD